MDKLAALVMETVGSLLEADRSTLFLFDSELIALRSCFAQGMDGQKSIVVPLRMGLVGTALLQRQTLNLVNASRHPYFNADFDSVPGVPLDSLLAVPIFKADDGQVLGGLKLINNPSGRFTPEDELVANDAARQFAECLGSNSVEIVPVIQKLDLLHNWIEFGHGAVFRLDQGSGVLQALHLEGGANQTPLNMRLGIAGVVALTGKALMVVDAASDPRFDASFDRETGYVTRQILCVPLHDSRDEVLGVIQVINKIRGSFDAGDLDLLVSVAGIVKVALENAMHAKEEELQFHSLVDALAASIDARDPLTAGHSRRVAQIAKGIALQLKFTEQDAELLEVAAILHDYGKIGVNDAVLKKEGRLDAVEYEHIKRHAQLSHDILDKIHFARKYRSVPLIAGSHHENLDGSGYPLGLKSHEIPFMAKILSVADVFEALTADRHYRSGLPLTMAMEIIDAGIGHKFESRIVAALREYLKLCPFERSIRPVEN